MGRHWGEGESEKRKERNNSLYISLFSLSTHLQIYSDLSSNHSLCYAFPQLFISLAIKYQSHLVTYVERETTVGLGKPNPCKI